MSFTAGHGLRLPRLRGRGRRRSSSSVSLSGVVRALHAWLTGHAEASYDVMRRYFGRSILLGLEILVAADLIRTVAVDPTWQNVVVLGLIVLIRTFLSFSLEVEMDGVVAVAPLAARQHGAGERPAAPDDGSPV